MRLRNFSKKLKLNEILRVEYLSDFLEAGGYKNGVGSRVVELFHLGACVSIRGISLNSLESIGEKK